MRVVAGIYGSRRLKAVPGENTRPTTDKIKESVFNMLGGYFEGGVCLDFYGGSGAMAIEAVSRGMDQAIITEMYRPAIQTIEANIAQLEAEDNFIILKGNNRQSLNKYLVKNASIRFDLIILDPPYAKAAIVDDIEWLEQHALIANHARIICETDHHFDLPMEIRQLKQVKQKIYGQTKITIYERG
ncbi:16S rRNA (guanine(966)-N(2))-methyltransferase RsmD [Fundicoccus culcitae]|uniref:16S rRNA (Guanine(966)-N(2))-methyltransferase RsmD n=1 Tax=Fundicoccus culcitae TaxID=2969821 RepID=A0ABY5P7A5_9LACT|nr:16S rRNA (guanine(966)-N(2))-methyltransferase RsmD [Fundicoccus culcitae]UUX34288.1 16S rRNA (guanine(966)-N(2))-methyltransferase RsmD [Fundicoccus culcitae]